MARCPFVQQKVGWALYLSEVTAVWGLRGSCLDRQELSGIVDARLSRLDEVVLAKCDAGGN